MTALPLLLAIARGYAGCKRALKRYPETRDWREPQLGILLILLRRFVRELPRHEQKEIGHAIRRVGFSGLR